MLLLLFSCRAFDHRSPLGNCSESRNWLSKYACSHLWLHFIVSAEARPQFTRPTKWRYAVDVCLSAGPSWSGDIPSAISYVLSEPPAVIGFTVSCILQLVISGIIKKNTWKNIFILTPNSVVEHCSFVVNHFLLEQLVVYYLYVSTCLQS